MVRQIDVNSPEAVAAREEEARRRRRDEEYVRQAYGLEPTTDKSGQVVGRLPDRTAVPPGTETIHGGMGGVRGYWVTYTDSSGKDQSKFQPEQVGSVTLTPRQAAVYAMGDGKTGQSITITSPDGHSVNFATGLDALPNYFDEKSGKYVPLTAAQYAKAHQAELAGDPVAWKSAMDAVTAAAGIAPAKAPGAAPGGAPGGAPAAGPGTGVGGTPPRGSSTGRSSGVTIGDDEDYRAQMTQVLHSLGVVNADPYITNDLVDRFALSKANPNGIAQYYRSTPSATVSGITLGQEMDYRKMTSQALSALGVTRDPTAEEIARFAKSGADPEGIHRAYSTSAEVLALNPGAQYDLSREDYLRQRTEIERASAATFDTPTDASPTAGNEPGYLKEAFSERMAPGEVEAGMADQQRRLGRPPTATDVQGFRTRPKVATEEDRAGPAGRITPVGPVQNIGRPDPNYVGPRRR